jgi:hypothetical protein
MKLIDIINPKKYYSDGGDEGTELRLFEYWKYTGSFHLLLKHIGLPITIYGNIIKSPFILILFPTFYIKFGEQTFATKFTLGNSPNGIYFYK